MNELEPYAAAQLTRLLGGIEREADRAEYILGRHADRAQPCAPRLEDIRRAVRSLRRILGIRR